MSFLGIHPHIIIITIFSYFMNFILYVSNSKKQTILSCTANVLLMILAQRNEKLKPPDGEGEEVDVTVSVVVHVGCCCLALASILDLDVLPSLVPHSELISQCEGKSTQASHPHPSFDFFSAFSNKCDHFPL